MRLGGFWLFVIGALLAGIAFVALGKNEYYYFAGYVILQSMIMAIAWNILGGFTGYVNFGSAGFFAVAAYTTIALNKYLQSKGIQAPLVVFIVGGAVVCGLIGLGTGYLTLRFRGVYFAIATLALAIVFQTLANNWDYVGGAKGTYILTPKPPLFFSSYVKFLFFVMLLIALFAIVVSRYIANSKFGRGLSAIRDDEVAAECMGVPTLRLKLVSTTVMGVLMGMAGAPYPFYVTFVDPLSAFSLGIAVNAIAMPMIGGTAYWYGPVIGAILLGTAQEVISVTISSELNVFLVGVVLVGFVVLAPAGLIGLFHQLRSKFRAPAKAASRA
jgi:branched-chain amino acid transport system permease protein